MDRICTKCGKLKPTADFQKIGGLARLCEHCRAHGRSTMRKRSKESRAAYHKTWRENNPKHAARVDRWNLEIGTGLKQEEFDAMLQDQGGVCAICKGTHRENSKFKRLHVDHDHVDGGIRGLLCSSCNTAIGLMKEDIPRLKSAIDYLESYK